MEMRLLIVLFISLFSLLAFLLFSDKQHLQVLNFIHRLEKMAYESCGARKGGTIFDASAG